MLVLVLVVVMAVVVPMVMVAVAALVPSLGALRGDGSRAVRGRCVVVVVDGVGGGGVVSPVRRRSRALLPSSVRAALVVVRMGVARWTLDPVPDADAGVCVCAPRHVRETWWWWRWLRPPLVGSTTPTGETWHGELLASPPRSWWWWWWWHWQCQWQR